MRRQIDEAVKISISLKMAVSILASTIALAAGAVTWSYAFQQRIVDLTDQRGIMRLKEYPTFPQLQNSLQGLQNEQHQDYVDLRNRMDAVKALIYQRTRARGR